MISSPTRGISNIVGYAHYFTLLLGLIFALAVYKYIYISKMCNAHMLNLFYLILCPNTAHRLVLRSAKP